MVDDNARAGRLPARAIRVVYGPPPIIDNNRAVFCSSRSRRSSNSNMNTVVMS